MSGAVIPYTFALPAASGSWIYSPFRDATVNVGWNASYTSSTIWPNGVVSEGAGTLFFGTRVAGAQVSLDFTGTEIALCFTTNGAQFTLSVDGNDVTGSSERSVDNPACAGYGSELALVSRVTSGSHRASLVITTPPSDVNADFRFFGGTAVADIAVSEGEQEVSELMIDDQEPRWIMKPGRGANSWDINVQQSAYHLTNSFMCIFFPDSTATYVFTGASAVMLHGAANRDSHSYTVKLNNETFESDMSVSGWEVGAVPIFFKAGLDPNQHYAIELANWNANDPNCPDVGFQVDGFRSCCANVDALQLLGSAALLNPTSTRGTTTVTSAITSTNSEGRVVSSSGSQPPASSGSPNIAAIVGAVVGTILVLGIACAVFFCLRRKGQHHARMYQQDVPPMASYAPGTPTPTVHPWMPSASQRTFDLEPAGVIPNPAFAASRTTLGGKVPPHASAAFRDDITNYSTHGATALVTFPPSTSDASSNTHDHAVSRSNSTRKRAPSTSSQAPTTSPTAGSATSEVPPLPPQDMERALQYVAQHMNHATNQRGSLGVDTLPPAYGT